MEGSAASLTVGDDRQGGATLVTREALLVYEICRRKATLKRDQVVGEDETRLVKLETRQCALCVCKRA